MKILYKQCLKFTSFSAPSLTGEVFLPIEAGPEMKKGNKMLPKHRFLTKIQPVIITAIFARLSTKYGRKDLESAISANTTFC